MKNKGEDFRPLLFTYAAYAIVRDQKFRFLLVRPNL